MTTATDLRTVTPDPATDLVLERVVDVAPDAGVGARGPTPTSW